MIIAVETFTRDLFDEILPFAKACWKESTEQKLETCAFYGDRDFDAEPDFDGYQRVHDANALLILTMRDEGKMVGYIVGMLYKSYHHKAIQCAGGDSVYVDPKYRGHTPALIGRFEKELKDRGVVILGWPTTQGGPVYTLLKAMGYVGDDIVMEKRLCV